MVIYNELLPEAFLDYKTIIFPFLKSYGSFVMRMNGYDFGNIFMLFLGFERLAE